MPVAEIGDQRIRFGDTGGDGPPIMFCHDHLDDHTSFSAQAGDLADVYRVITWDARGAEGATTPDGRRFTYGDLARDLFGLLDRLGIERAVLAGHGQGAALSVRAALLHPDRVRALVLIDAFLPPEREHPLLDADDVANRMDEIAVPVLVIHGGDDPTWPPGRARRVARTVTDCRGVVEVAGAAGGCHRTHAGVVTGAIRDFLEGLPA